MSSEIEEMADAIRKAWWEDEGDLIPTGALVAMARAVLGKAQSLAVEDGWVRLDDLEALFEEKERGAIDPLVYNPDVRPVPKDYDTSNAVGLATLLKEKKGA